MREQKAWDGGVFPFKDGIGSSCHRPGTSLLFRPGHCLSFLSLFLSLSRLNPARLLYVGRWSFDLISSEILPFVLITNCFTLNTQQHKIFPSALSTPTVSQHLSLSSSHLLLLLSLSLFDLSPSSLLHSGPASKSNIFFLMFVGERGGESGKEQGKGTCTFPKKDVCRA